MNIYLIEKCFSKNCKRIFKMCCINIKCTNKTHYGLIKNILKIIEIKYMAAWKQKSKIRHPIKLKTQILFFV